MERYAAMAGTARVYKWPTGMRRTVFALAVDEEVRSELAASAQPMARFRDGIMPRLGSRWEGRSARFEVLWRDARDDWPLYWTPAACRGDRPSGVSEHVGILLLTPQECLAAGGTDASLQRLERLAAEPSCRFRTGLATAAGAQQAEQAPHFVAAQRSGTDGGLRSARQGLR